MAPSGRGAGNVRWQTDRKERSLYLQQVESQGACNALPPAPLNVFEQRVMAMMNGMKEIGMSIFWRGFKLHTWLWVLPLLVMAAYGTTATAAQTPSFSATASGAINNLTVTATINVADADVGKNGNYYLGFNFNQEWYFNNGTGWVRYASGALPVYAAAPLASQTGEVVRGAVKVEDDAGGSK